MVAAEGIDTILQTGKATTEEALALFDRLNSVDLDFMLGRWQGTGLHTGHPMDGLLEVTSWYGKEFIHPDCAHPLLCRDGNGALFKVVPNQLMVDLALRLPILKAASMQPFYALLGSLQKTEKSQARLRMMEHRNRVSATMVYDNLPINDIFRKVDEDTVLGLMDYKSVPQPFFFVLRRA